MTIEVLLFAQLQDAAGTDRIIVEVEKGTTASQLAVDVVTKHANADLASLPLRCAIDEEFVANHHVLRDGDRLAILTPVCGG